VPVPRTGADPIVDTRWPRGPARESRSRPAAGSGLRCAAGSPRSRRSSIKWVCRQLPGSWPALDGHLSPGADRERAGSVPALGRCRDAV